MSQYLSTNVVKVCMLADESNHERERRPRKHKDTKGGLFFFASLCREVPIALIEKSHRGPRSEQENGGVDKRDELLRIQIMSPS
ncbi:MAG: hypothetical protein NT013_08110 [Planctomycetia bacterium]|nr:hypothetical protein [Planctomycetia bacterium]